MGVLVASHIASGVLALALGLIVLLRPKGGRLHRGLGYAYTAAMLVLNGTAFGIYKVFGTFGPFHVLAVICLVSLALGVVAAIRRRSGWRRRHYNWMSWSYIGLLAATSAEVALRVPAIQSTGAFGFALIFILPAVVVFVGRQFLVRNRNRLAPHPVGESTPTGTGYNGGNRGRADE